jgi:hypothetical protein
MTAKQFVSNTSQPSPGEQLRDMLVGYRRTQLVHVAAKLGIADLLKDGSKSSEELAQATGAHPQALYRVLRTLAGMGIFAEREDHRFQLTPLGELLQVNTPGTLYYNALLAGGETFWQPWGNLYQNVMTGENAFMITHGVTHYEYLQQHPQLHEVFNKNMAMVSAPVIPAILDAYDFSGIGTLVDVGGGRGQLITAILRKYPQRQGVLFDLPATIDEVRSAVRSETTGDRCTLRGGSFFDAVPAGDACVVKSVVQMVHNQEAATILRNCKAAVGPTGKVIVIEIILRRPPDMFIDIHLMVVGSGGGTIRTEEELRTLFSEAGLNLVRIVHTTSQFSVLETVAV